MLEKMIADKVAGLVLVDEDGAGVFTGIYLCDPDGGLYPCRTVLRSDEDYHRSVVAAWISDPRYKSVDDRRNVQPQPADRDQRSP